MPSMYDSDEEEEDCFITDARDESTCTVGEQIDTRCRNSRFSLMRCLAWSQAEDDKEESSITDMEDADDNKEFFLLKNASGGCASFNSTHSALIDSIHHNDDNGTKNIHWIERVASDKKIDSMFSEKIAESCCS